MNHPVKNRRLRHPAPLTVLLITTITLAGCGSSSSEAEPSPSTPQSQTNTISPSASPFPTVAPSPEPSTSTPDTSTTGSAASPTPSAVAPAQESPAAASSPQGSPIALDHSQVLETENLVQEAQAAVASAELLPTGETSEEETTGNLDLSPETEEKIYSVATGVAADDFLATAYEYQSKGWQVQGKPVFVGEPKVSPTTYNGQEAKLLEVCVDSSQVTVTDAAGNNMLSETAPTRSRTIYTLTTSEGDWKIAAQDFPANPDC